LIVTDWLREPVAYLEPSQHWDGSAVDVRPSRRLSQRAIYDAVTYELQASGIVYGQAIFYPFSDWHIHFSLATGAARNSVLVASDDERSYLRPSPALLASFPSKPSPFPPSVLSAGVMVIAGALTLTAAAAALTA
jgi:hypothetical protein